MHFRITAALALATLLLAGPAPADEPARTTPPATYAIDEVTVTADKLGRASQEVPASVSVYDEAELADMGLETTDDLFDRTPNMHMTTMGPQAMLGNPIVSMRGLSSFMTGAPVMSLLVDDVYYPGLSLDLLDIERVEVLRGPQGTMYGRNTEAGLINVITRKPTTEPSGRAELELGDYNTQRARFSAGGAAIADKLLVRLAGRYENSDGYFSNDFGGADDVDKHRNLDGRLTLDWLASPDLELSWTTDAQDYDSNYAEFALLDKVDSDPHHVSVDFAGEAEKRSVGSALRAQQKLGDLKLVSITSWRKMDASTYQDLDFTAYDIMRLKLKQDYQTVGEELRLVSDEPGQALRWVGGLFVYHETDDLDYATELRPMSGMAGNLRQQGDTATTGTALFGQASYTLWELVELTAGLRYDHESKDFDYAWSGGAFGVPDLKGSTGHDFDAWLPKFAVSLRLHESLTPYASVSRGFKSGGFNIKSAAGRSFDSEFAWNYELGLKTQWFDRRLTLDLAAFYIDWSDLQVEQPDYPDFTVVNAAAAASHGFEAELRARPLSGLELLASFGCVRSTFDEFKQGAADYADNDVPNVPAYTYRLGGVYRFLGGWFLSGEYIGVGPMYFDAANTKEQSAYGLANARAGYELKRVKTYFFVDNIFDETYATRAFAMSGQWYGRAGDPLTFGVKLVLEY